MIALYHYIKTPISYMNLELLSLTSTPGLCAIYQPAAANQKNQ